MIPLGRSVAVALLTTVVVSGCAKSIPEDASTQDFCSAGEKYSALQQVPFSEGVKAIDRLAEVGTPAGISKGARAGFEELVDRMRDSSDAADFRRRTKAMSDQEAEHLLDLNDYIRKTCVADLG